MTKKNKKQQKNKFQEGLKKIFNSSKILIIVLILIILGLIIFSNHLMKSSKTYMFNGKSDYVTILNGVISLNYDINLISGSDIEYTNPEDIEVVEYRIGYYVSKDNTLSPLVTKSGEDADGFSLMEIVNEMSAYNITEPYRVKRFFTKENIKHLEEGLYFIIEAETKTGEEILDKIELNLSKVSN